MDGVKNTLSKVVAADFDIPSNLSSDAKDLIICLLKKVLIFITFSLFPLCVHYYNTGVSNYSLALLAAPCSQNETVTDS